MTASINMDTTTTTQSISQNDNFSLTSYSLQGFLQFLMHNSKQIIISMLFLLLAFGQKLFSNTFSIDTQGIIQNNDALYKSWFELERFGLVLFKKLTGTYLYNNALASFTMVVFFGISAMVWAYLLCSASHATKLQPAFFMIPYVASPIFAEMLGFLLLGPEISIAATLTAISLMMWANAAASNSAKRRILLVIVSVVCATIAFTMYLAMVTIFITGTAMLYILQFGNRAQWDERKKSSWIFLVGSILIFGASYLAYKILNEIAMHLAGVTTSAYISDQSRWGKDSFGTIIRNIGHHAQELYSGSGIFYSALFSIAAIVFAVVAVACSIRKRISVLAVFGFYTAASRSDDYVCGTGYRPISTHRNDLSSGVCLHAHDVTLQIIAQHSSTSNSVDPHHYCWMEPSPHYQQNFLHRKYRIQSRCAHRASH